ncbi:hypothetical protein BZG36_01608 [Bifiguratus adelaidae]|uniref:lysine--tRNA ligase n=1 Tax=Bifiguratus adelaidae TaxID=1938954 RepID=A0A261Y4C1_9FUNG|nr:hypothetical protein BZG36_01608 [Bifiguratus adelaidae]
MSLLVFGHKLVEAKSFSLFSDSVPVARFNGNGQKTYLDETDTENERASQRIRSLKPTSRVTTHFRDRKQTNKGFKPFVPPRPAHSSLYVTLAQAIEEARPNRRTSGDLLCILRGLPTARHVVRKQGEKKGDNVSITTLLLGDDTLSGFTVEAWGDTGQQLQQYGLGDALLVYGLLMKCYKTQWKGEITNTSIVSLAKPSKGGLHARHLENLIDWSRKSFLPQLTCLDSLSSPSYFEPAQRLDVQSKKRHDLISEPSRIATSTFRVRLLSIHQPTTISSTPLPSAITSCTSCLKVVNSSNDIINAYIVTQHSVNLRNVYPGLIIDLKGFHVDIDTKGGKSFLVSTSDSGIDVPPIRTVGDHLFPKFDDYLPENISTFTELMARHYRGLARVKCNIVDITLPAVHPIRVEDIQTNHISKLIYRICAYCSREARQDTNGILHCSHCITTTSTAKFQWAYKPILMQFQDVRVADTNKAHWYRMEGKLADDLFLGCQARHFGEASQSLRPHTLSRLLSRWKTLCLVLAIVCLLAPQVRAWEQGDYEIFDLVDELELAEGKEVNFYSWLKVEPSASVAQINRAYRKLSLELHPDKNKHDALAHQRFARLGKVAAILRNDTTRERYNFFYKNGVPRWRGTGYYYARYRPGLGTVIVFLVLLTNGLQYVVHLINYHQEKRKIQQYVADAREFLARRTPKAHGAPTFGKSMIEIGDHFMKCDVKGDGHIIFYPEGNPSIELNVDTVPKPRFTNTFLFQLPKMIIRKLNGEKEEDVAYEEEEIVEEEPVEKDGPNQSDSGTLRVRKTNQMKVVAGQRKNVKKHNTLKSCWVIHNSKVYDVTEFVQDHPGGEDLIMEYAGTDVTKVMADVLEHEHSESAYELLDEYLIGRIALEDEVSGAKTSDSDAKTATTGPLQDESEAKLTHRSINSSGPVQSDDYERIFQKDFHPTETNTVDDYKKTQFLDLKKPLFMQMCRARFSKAFYLEQIHKPRYIPGSAPFFGHWLLEPLTKTPWWVVPIVWIPWIIYNLHLSVNIPGATVPYTSTMWVVGIFIWTFLEYGLHRFLFHLDDWLPDHQAFLVLHFTIHGVHHYLPCDKMRLVMPPALNIVISSPLMKLAHTLFAPSTAHAIIAGAFTGYVMYDCIHYYLHHAKVFEVYFKEMKTYHLAHHYKDYKGGFGITSKLWDHMFRSSLAESDSRPTKDMRLNHFASDRIDPYPRYKHPDPAFTSTREFAERWDHLSPSERVESESIALTGRVVSKRASSAKLVFYDIVQDGFALQVVASYNHYNGSLDSFSALNRLICRGDILSITGIPGKTQKGQTSLFATSAQLLAPCLHDIPRTGLKDPEKRFRNRHVDFLVNPQASNILRTRSKIIASIRHYLESKGFLEVETPILSSQSGGANAQPFVTTAHALDMSMQLRIAPELYLKQLVVGGFDKVFEIGKQFRNEGIDADHNPEFTTCEFYYAYANLETLYSLTEDMVKDVAKSISRCSPENAAEAIPPVLDLSKSFRRLHVLDELERVLGPLPPLDNTSESDAIQALLDLAASHNLTIPKPHTLTRVLDKLISEYIEPQCIEPTFLYGHPVCMSPLAKAMTDNRGRLVSARFELFLQGKEIVNAYEELNDPQEQRERFAKQQLDRQSGDVEAQLPDAAYCDALEFGLPPTAGWGMGIDRLVAILTGAKHIREVLAFPVLRHV